MKKNILVIAACSVALALSACSKGKDAKIAPPSPQAAQGPAYKVLLTSACVDEYAEYCVAQYGFSVSADGVYEMGPGPEGQRKHGRVTPGELEMLEAAVAAATGGFDAARVEACTETEANYSLDSVIVSRLAGDLPVLRTTETNICFQTATPEQADALHKAIRLLAEKYYNLPFPDACEDAVQAVEALYPGLQTCSADSECTYVTTEFDVIPPGVSQYVTTDACSTVRPMIVGNITSIINAQAKAYELLNEARYVCGYRIIRDDCTGISGFMSSEGAPVCDQASKTCRINPAIQLR